MAAIPSPPDSRAAKQQVRHRILTAREGLDPTMRGDYSRCIAQRIIALPSFVAARTVLLFFHFGSEWTSGLIVHEALQQGKTVVLPRVPQPLGSSRQLTLHSIHNIARDTTPGMMGIREPWPEQPVVTPDKLDWVLVPGLAFSPYCARLGYGAGLYDQLLPQIPPQIPRVAGAFDVQIVADLPTDAHDCPVDAVHTESRVFYRSTAV